MAVCDCQPSPSTVKNRLSPMRGWLSPNSGARYLRFTVAQRKGVRSTGRELRATPARMSAFGCLTSEENCIRRAKTVGSNGPRDGKCPKRLCSTNLRKACRFQPGSRLSATEAVKFTKVGKRATATTDLPASWRSWRRRRPRADRTRGLRPERTRHRRPDRSGSIARGPCW